MVYLVFMFTTYTATPATATEAPGATQRQDVRALPQTRQNNLKAEAACSVFVFLLLKETCEHWKTDLI